ncbi:hypothetical protein EUX98_g7348 [Antrodiella citrinella]|uniref:Heat shock protein 70 n=1 Tax=Antrodiella citrinella TaxID=2447956 RepID=A0A4S4MP61_9APHY|nr:hypothetical protein EUX98_g7348 [Antrodiella citrinella]
MAVVGVDFGTLHSKIGVARHRGIDIIVNEVSNRQTPSLVSFGIKQRSIGESAKTLESSNFRNTVGSLKRLLGRTINDPEIAEVEKKFTHVNLTDVGGTVGAKVTYLGEPHEYSITQLTAAYLGKLRDIAANELKTGVTDIVITVPGWYTDIQRRALLDAAQIANLNVLRLINDTTAIALGYGITKQDLPEAENPRHVVFVDVGHSSLSVAAVAFWKGNLTVKSTAYDRHIGGRDIDYALVQYFSKEFKTKYGIDVMTNPKAMFRLTAGCDRVKKVLSANAESPLNVESIVTDVDATSKLTREEYEELIAPVLARIEAPIKQALADSGLTLDEIDAIELVGGCTRIPAVRAKIQAAFGGKTLSTTLNQDEAAARGATFACAMLSPIFRVRDFAMHDISPYPVRVHWERAVEDPDEDTELTVFNKGNPIPSTKVLSFYRKEPFDLQASYGEPSSLPGGINPWIAKFHCKQVVPEGAPQDVTVVKVKTRLNHNGVLSFEQAYIEEVEEKEDAMAVDGEEAPKKKKLIRKKDVPFIWSSTSLDSTKIEEYRAIEAEMYASDKLVMDTEDRKNALEEYVYDVRGKLDDRYAPYVQPNEKSKLLAALQEAEEWLYSEEGEDATKSAYVARLDALKVLGDPITNRFRETEERSKVVSQLRETINKYMGEATSNDDKYSHIDEKDKQSIVEKAATIQQWLEDQIARQTERAKNVDPVLKSAEVLKKRDEIIYFATPILTKPKPKVVPTTTGQDAPKSGQQTPQTNEQQAQEEKKDNGPPEMDVD